MSKWNTESLNYLGKGSDFFDGKTIKDVIAKALENDPDFKHSDLQAAIISMGSSLTGSDYDLKTVNAQKAPGTKITELDKQLAEKFFETELVMQQARKQIAEQAVKAINDADSLNRLTGMNVGKIVETAAVAKAVTEATGDDKLKDKVNKAIENVGIDPEKLPKLNATAAVEVTPSSSGTIANPGAGGAKPDLGTDKNLG